jgi:hypothetical protein
MADFATTSILAEAAQQIASGRTPVEGFPLGLNEIEGFLAKAG